MLTLPFIPRADLELALQRLGRRGTAESSAHVRVVVQGLPLCFPYRVYYGHDDVKAACRATGVASQVALCLGTRHHDGFLREACVGPLLSVQEAWVAPFVLQLLGEYVLEIGARIESGLSDQALAHYVGFARENPAYMQRLGDRATSYWNAYYRRAYPRRSTYPALRVLARLAHLVARTPDDPSTAG